MKRSQKAGLIVKNGLGMFRRLSTILFLWLCIGAALADTNTYQPTWGATADFYLETDPNISADGKIPLILIHGISLTGGSVSDSINGWDQFTSYFDSNTDLKSKYKISLVSG